MHREGAFSEGAIMQTLYSDQSRDTIRSQLNRRLAVLFVVLALLLAVFVWAMANRTEWLAITAACVSGCFAVFFTDLFCMPLVRYQRLIRSALTGRHHEKALEFCRLEPDVSVVDGVSCRSLIFLGDPDKHGSREMLMYWDALLPLPELTPGAVYNLRYTGKNIIGIQSDPS